MHGNSFFAIELIRYMLYIVKRYFRHLILLSCLSLAMYNLREQELLVKSRSVVVDFFTPVVKIFADSTHNVGQFFGFIGNYYDMSYKYKLLEDENEILKAKIDQSLVDIAENKDLKELMDYVGDPAFSYKTAKVISDISDGYSNQILINAGKKHGIKRGQAVTYKNILIGRVTEVNEKTSRVVSLVDSHSKIPVYGISSRERLIAAGNNSNTLTPLYLPEDHKLKDDEFLYTVGDGELFPSGLLVGNVVIGNSGIEIKPAMRYNKLYFVNILDQLKDF